MPFISTRQVATWLLAPPAFFLLAVPDADAQQGVVPRPPAERTTEEGIVPIPWAIRTLDNVITLRQPRGYTSLLSGMFGAGFGSDYGDKALKGSKSETNFLFSALLPDMKPWTRETLPEFKIRGGGAVVEGLVTSVLVATKAPTEEAYLRILFNTERDNLLHDPQLRPPGVVIGEKPARFGLNRIGPLNLPQQRSPYYLPEDLYFIGKSPETSPVFIVCQAEELPTREENPGSKIFEQCKHFMQFRALSAVVRLRYRREYLKDWREIQTKVEGLLTSFLPGNRPVP
jgi:hypothetical protein